VSSELTKRVAVGVIGAPIAIAILMYGDWALAALLAVVSAVAAWELFRLAEHAGLMPMDQIGVAIAGLIPLVVDAAHLGMYPPDAALGPLSLAVIVMLVLLAIAIWSRGAQGKPLGAVAVTAFGAAYTGGTLSYAFSIRYHEYAFAPAALGLGAHSIMLPSGGLLLLLPVLLTWASDIGAYAVGRTIGKHKLIPSVSPGKTIEGSIGGLVASMVVAWLYMRYVLHPASHLDFKWAPVGVLAFGAIVSIAAQIGDLVESLLKREAGVKDSSHIIPGHGGVLDRLDSLLFVLPVAYVLITPMLTWAPT
jgi:phosphatidate cytidylyltransferase